MTTPRSGRRHVICSVLALFAATILAEGGRAAGLDATSWTARVDPPTRPMPAPASTDFAIPFPANTGAGVTVLYPATMSPFVAIGKNASGKDVREVWDFARNQVIGTFRGPIGLDDRTVALSPDGAYLAGKTATQKAVEVRAIADGKVVRSIAIASPLVDFVDFAAEGRVVFGRLRDLSLRVSDFKTGAKVVDVALAKEPARDALAFSHGRAYLAAATSADGTLRVYDLATGKVVGQAPTPKAQGQAARCVGLMFSPDGAELAGLFEVSGSFRIACWDAATGKNIVDLDLGTTVEKPPLYAARGIDWFPNKSAWLVLGSAIVDRATGKKIWIIPFDDRKLKVSPRRFLDDDHLMVVSYSPIMALRSAEIPREKTLGANRIARLGGMATEGTTTAAAPAPTRSSRAMTPAPDATNPTRPRLAAEVTNTLATPRRRPAQKTIALTGKWFLIDRILFADARESKGFAVGSERVKDAKNNERTRWIERLDLAGNKNLGRLDLTGTAEPIACAPDASALLLREPDGRDLLEVVSAADGKRLGRWRPFDQEKENSRAVLWAEFLDPDKVLTSNADGTLALWSINQSKPIYSRAGAIRGTPALSADRALLVGFDGSTPVALDPASGDPKPIKFAVAADVGVRPYLKRGAVRPDGQEYAGLFGNDAVVCWDLKTGQITAEGRPPCVAKWSNTDDIGLSFLPRPGGAPAEPPPPTWLGTSLEWCGPRHLLIDGRGLVDLGTRRVAWVFDKARAVTVGPDGQLWCATSGSSYLDSILAAIASPEAEAGEAEALAADPKAPALLRPGSKVGITLEMAGPPGDPEGFRRTLLANLTRWLEANGVSVVPGGADVRLVLSVKDKDIGRTVRFERFGGAAGRTSQEIRLVDLVCEMSVVDARGTAVSWSPPFAVPLQPAGMMVMIPGNEPDSESFLKKKQWDRVKNWALAGGPPYFVARSGGRVVRLPGRTDLEDPSAD